MSFPCHIFASQVENKVVFNLPRGLTTFKILPFIHEKHGLSYHCDEKLAQCPTLKLQVIFTLQSTLRKNSRGRGIMVI